MHAGLQARLGGRIDEEAVVAGRVVARALQHDVVEVWQLVLGVLLYRVLRGATTISCASKALSA